MANILDRYGIKEVADVTFYELDNNGNPTVPVLYLDTLKVSTIEQTAESSEARGGKGNPALITWDYGKEISVTLEDALYSPKSLALMFGDKDGAGKELTDEYAEGLLKTIRPGDTKDFSAEDKTCTVEVNGTTIPLTDCVQYTADGKVAGATDEVAYITGKFVPTNAMVIDVSANTFPGNYYVTGDTYARSETTGKDEFFQFIIPKAKVLSESNTITLEAEGDPTVFSMNLKVLRPKSGKMMQLVQYAIAEAKAE
jgi:hypothetical protein